MGERLGFLLTLGTIVGATVGFLEIEGLSVGNSVGNSDGLTDGLSEGSTDGQRVLLEGCRDTEGAREVLGTNDGDSLG